MDYFKAEEIGKRSLSNLIQDNWAKNQSVGKGIKNAMSDKMKAFGKRVGANFTGMNIIRKLTGSNLLTALYGKVTGKSKSDIAYFTGRKKPKARRLGNIMALPGTESSSDGQTSSLLQSMFDFMVQSETIRQRRAETERSFREERDNEEERRHGQFIKALQLYTGVGNATKVEEKKEGGLLDTLKSIWDSFIAPFKWALDWLVNNKAFLLSLARFFAGPLGAAMLAGGAVIWLAEQLKEYFRNNVADMKVISPTEAANILKNGDQKQIDKAGGETYLRDVITNAPKRATEILARGDNREILAAGGVQKLKEIEKDIIDQPEKRNAMEDLSPTVTPRAVFAGNGLAKKSKEQKWDKEFGAYYDPVTGKRLEKAKPVDTPKPTVNKPQTATPVSQEPSAPAPATQPTAEPVSTAPTLGKINDSIAENNDLNLEQTTAGSSVSSPVILQNSKSNQLKDTPVSATASTRDETTILDIVRRNSMSQI